MDVVYEVIIAPLGLSLAHPGIVGDLTFSKNSPEEGEATTATCTWTGDPPPFVQWFKDGKLLAESELPSHVRISPVSTGMGSKLEILEAELDDAGDYTCNVSNPVGFDFQVKRLEVQGDMRVPDSGSAVMLHVTAAFKISGLVY